MGGLQTSLRRLSIPIVVLVAAGFSPASGGENWAWQPEKTWVVMVGVLEWQQSGMLHGFPKSERRDSQLAELLKRRGVPAAQMEFIEDRHATRKQILGTLEDLLPRTNPGDFLIFYYAGHGISADGKTYLANYDITADTARTGLPVAMVFAAIARGFRGSHVLLTADCCHSGGLGDEARKHHGDMSFAALTSSQANSTSTGHWTFTECLLSGFGGDPAADLNADGAVTLDELSRYTENEMAFAEGQLASFTTSKGFNSNLTLSAAGKKPRQVSGQHLEAEWKGSWWPVRVLETSGGQTKVHYIGFGPEWDERVSPERLRPYRPKTIAKGTSVQVEWQGKWWPATVRDSRLGIHLIDYTGFGHEWDEWVGPKRIRPTP